MSDTTKYIIWAIVVGVVFAIFWWQGQLQRLTTYVRETKVELEKCNWPAWDELKGSTVVVMISILLLGGFTVIVDQILFLVFLKF